MERTYSEYQLEASPITEGELDSQLARHLWDGDYSFRISRRIARTR